jgi:4'-phosphopantetheinyl transferase
VPSPAERERAERFVFERDRLRFLVGRSMLRWVLSDYARVAPQAWAFGENEFGRPEIVGPACPLPLRFNVSHTEGLVAVAVCLERPIGVDVEHLERRVTALELAERYFSPLEAADLRRCPDVERAARFFDYWTLKEAYVKARGMGLSAPLREFSIVLVSPEAARIVHHTAGGMRDDEWQFARFAPTPQHKLAVALQRPAGLEMGVTLRWAMPFDEAV